MMEVVKWWHLLSDNGFVEKENKLIEVLQILVYLLRLVEENKKVQKIMKTWKCQSKTEKRKSKFGFARLCHPILTRGRGKKEVCTVTEWMTGRRLEELKGRSHWCTPGTCLSFLLKYSQPSLPGARGWSWCFTLFTATTDVRCKHWVNLILPVTSDSSRLKAVFISSRGQSLEQRRRYKKDCYSPRISFDENKHRHQIDWW